MRNLIKTLIEMRAMFFIPALLLMADAFGNRDTLNFDVAGEFLWSAGFVALNLALSIASLYVKDND